MADWSIQNAREMYHIQHWSDGFFDINPAGNLCAFPHGPSEDASCIDLYQLSKDIRASGTTFPILLRFTDVLHKRIQMLSEAFAKARKNHHYQGDYLCAYPIKVNQQRRVVEAILKNGNTHVAIETGSKPELLAALGMHSQHISAIICNGYKDREYIRLALIGQRLGHQVYIILEKAHELNLVLEEADKLNIQPVLGVRIRLSATSAGKWQDSGGEKSKFGFSTPQLLEMVEFLRKKNRLDWLQILHFHLGSQIANIADIQRCMHEGARYYETLRNLGAPINTIDVGGGLGIDYEGTRSRSFCSMNYSVQEYANNIVYTITDMCTQNNLPHPRIITESGRALTAHHAMLITDVIATEPPFQACDLAPPAVTDVPILHELWESHKQLSESTALEAYHDACHWISEIHTMYIHGLVGLQERAYAEQVYFASCTRISQLLKPKIRAHRDILDELNEKLAYKLVCNFSLFQSLPDAWAIGQVFPIMPLTNLDQAPVLHGVLHDITCDSDGRIDTYVNNFGLEKTLPFPPHLVDQPFLIGFFLVGAYQEILGDLHNLFGDTNSIHVELTGDGSFRLTHAMQGDTVEKTLQHVNFNTDDLVFSYQHQLNTANLLAHENEEFLMDLTRGLKGYTYFEE